MNPQSTYRLQFHKDFTFRDAVKIIPYLADLGITHVYASPYLAAVAGSTHGYDVIDHNRLNPEIGSEADYEAFIAALKQHGMSHILDMVPNHAGVDTNDNLAWNAVLESGESGPYAHFFDIDWRGSPNPVLRGRVLLPILGEPYAKCLEQGQLKLSPDATGNRIVLRYFNREIPIAPETCSKESLEHINSHPDLLDDLLNRQHYRLAWWRVASEEINYRRFFDITSLAALSMERPEVFEATHKLVFRLLSEGKIAGLRIDHPDGLKNPREYLHRLQQHFDPAPLYVVVEKILAFGERLPSDWPCNGTSGYDFLAMANELFVDGANEEPFTDLYQKLAGDNEPFDELCYQKKAFILDHSLAGDLDRLTRRLARLARKDRRAHDFTWRSLRRGLREIIAAFPVYRTYIESSEVRPEDLENVGLATTRAIERNPSMPVDLFHFVRDMILQRPRFAAKFQQLTAPTMAKGVEDTAFYLYHRLISLNEVGGDPSRFGLRPADLHRYLADRQKHWPYALSALSTHDTKRSEDVRARLNVLSEIPDQWEAHVTRWMERKVDKSSAPSPAEQYHLYQTLVGAWPLRGLASHRDEFAKRIQQYMRKALREAKLHTNWTDPNQQWEEAMDAYITAIFDDPSFMESIESFVRGIARHGLMNSLSQTLLRLAAPGVPDTYQGCELWDFSLVDPDNRRPVDYEIRQEALREVKQIESVHSSQHLHRVRALMDQMEDGRVKLWVIRQMLHCRRRNPELFTKGEYHPLHATGRMARNVFTFVRRHDGVCAIAVIPRLMADIPVGATGHWAKTRINLPQDLACGIFENILTGEPVTPVSLDDQTYLTVADVLANFPVALLIGSAETNAA